MRGAALVAAALLSLAGAPGARATEVSRSELAALAERAPDDPAARAELEAVTSVDGSPADLRAALAGARGPVLDARLSELARSARDTSTTGGVEASEARSRAADILADDELRPPEPAGDGDGLELPDVPLWLALAAALAILALSAVVARSLGRNTVIERERTAAIDREAAPARPRELDREADEAERNGDYAAAVRLRFQAGLKRLDAMGAIELRPSLTAAGAARESGSGIVARLADAYERIAFGGREASAGDAQAHRSGWRDAVREARPR